MPTSRTTSRFSRRGSTAGSSSRSWTSSRFGGSNRWSGFGTSTSSTRGTSYSPAQFNNVVTDCEQRIGSYRNISSQCTGPGRITTFSPTTANKFLRLVDNGTLVYRFSNPEFCRFFGQQLGAATTPAAFRTLRQKFGTGIKAVSRGRNNCWLVAASESVSGRPFRNYTWK